MNLTRATHLVTLYVFHQNETKVHNGEVSSIAMGVAIVQPNCTQKPIISHIKNGKVQLLYAIQSDDCGTQAYENYCCLIILIQTNIQYKDSHQFQRSFC